MANYCAVIILNSTWKFNLNPVMHGLPVCFVHVLLQEIFKSQP